jgi:hypothetical protein
MVDAIRLNARALSGLRRLLLTEPEPGEVLPRTGVDALTRLVGCDSCGMAEADEAGHALRVHHFPHGTEVPLGTRICDGPLPTGLIHLGQLTRPPADENAPGIRGDTVWIGFPTRNKTVVQIYLDRYQRQFSPEDLALLAIIKPVLRRLMIGTHTVPRATHLLLTASERRVLGLVADGASNREVAEELTVSVATIASTSKTPTESWA